jgi:Trk K+ transport system NAD-binding subunit
MATTPFLMMIARRFTGNGETRERDDLDRPEAAEPAHAIVIGYGRFGQTVAQMLMAKAFTVTLIDSNPSQIDRSTGFGAKVYYGDGTRIDLLRQAGADQARAIIFCVDGATLDARALTPVLETFRQAAVLVRAFDRRHLLALDGLDLRGVVREVYESAVCMGRRALDVLGVEGDEIDRIEQEYRRRDAARLEIQGREGDPGAARDMMFAPGRSWEPEGL